MPASTHTGNAYLNLFLRGVVPSAPAGVFLSLHTANPGIAGASEVTAATWPGYMRKDLAVGAAIGTAFTVPSNKRAANAKQILWAGKDGAGSITLTHFAIWSAASGGTLLHFGELENARTLFPTDEFVFHIGELSIEVD